MSPSPIRPLSAELQKVALERCHESPELIGDNVEELRTWIKKSPHLKARTDERLLLSFLRACQFSLEESKKRLDDYYALRNAFPEVLCNRMLTDSLLELYCSGIHVIPKKPVGPTGPRVIISQYMKCDPKRWSPRDAFKLLFMLLEIMAIEDDNASVSGLIYVVDARNVNMEQMMQYDPFLLKKTWMLVERCLPLRFEAIHLINMRRDGQAIFNFVTSFMPNNMPFKFMVHKKAEDLYEHLAREAMPIEYGGHNGYQGEALDAWQKKLHDYEVYFIEDEQYGTNEKLRVGLSTNWETGELSGVNGSFRKLEVD